MRNDGHGGWNDLIVESGAYPPPLSEDRYRGWMAGRRIFISSVMDNEMNPSREALRAYLHQMGAVPIMWEEITPRDEGPQVAYLGGVDRSSIFVLIVGSRYGVTDASGYSPTHQEGNRAAERKIPRMLFTLGTVRDSERDGRLNDWLRSLFNEVAGASFPTTSDLVAQLDARLREMAAQSERLWIKLGNLVFPGKVTARFEGSGGGQFVVTARVSGGEVRRALLELNQPFGRRSAADTLTWSEKSFPVQVEGVSIDAEYTAEDAVEIRCRTPQNWYGHTSSTYAMMAGGGSLSQIEMARIWTRRAFFGEAFQGERRGLDMIDSFTEPETATLPEVLTATGARGWLAEGLTKLYAVEEVSRRYGGYFQHIEVGPATATGVRIDGSFTLGSGVSQRTEMVLVQGVVPLRQ
ncbi:MAG: DUF4062 domain-containing protein [Pyrinomonadaceae bacterium]